MIIVRFFITLILLILFVGLSIS